jgi:hypothetical protein
MHHQNLEVDAWLNVIGHITPFTSRSRCRVQAIRAWFAGAITLQQSEAALSLEAIHLIFLSKAMLTTRLYERDQVA